MSRCCFSIRAADLHGVCTMVLLQVMDDDAMNFEVKAQAPMPAVREVRTRCRGDILHVKFEYEQ